MKKILVVDDSSFMRMIIKKALSGVDVHIIEASNGEEAIRMFRKHQPEVVTLDITMPGKTGLETLEALLTQNEQANVIICSSMVNGRTDEEVRLAGAKDFIKKPFQNEDFKKRVCQFLTD